MAKKHRKPSGLIFYPVYWTLVLLGAAAIMLMMRVLWDNMEDYEASMPKYVAQEVGKIFAEKDFAAIYEHDDVSLCAAEGKEAYVEYMLRLVEGQEITYQESYSANENEKVYKVMAGSSKLGSFTLCKSGETTAYGNELWALKEVKTGVITSSSYLITVPESSKVYADGQLLGEDAVVERGLELTDEYLPEGVERMKWCTYSVDRCFSVPVFRVEDSKGREQKFMPNEEGRLTAQLNSDDDELRPLVEDRVFKVGRALSQFTSDDCESSIILQYVKDDTNASRYIWGFDGGWFGIHKGFKFENMRTENYVSYSEDMFSCEIYFDYIIRFSNVTKTYPTAYKFFFVKEGEKWMLFDFTSAAAG